MFCLRLPLLSSSSGQHSTPLEKQTRKRLLCSPHLMRPERSVLFTFFKGSV